MSGNSGTGGHAPLTAEAYRWALEILQQPPPTADEQDNEPPE
jgi:hypothetical protein